MDKALLQAMSVEALQHELNELDAQIEKIRADQREIQAVLQPKDAAEHAARRGDPDLAQTLKLK